MGRNRASWVLAAVMAASLPQGATAQSSSPFSGLFGGGSRADSPVELQFRVEGGEAGLADDLRATSLISGAQAEGRVTGQDMLAAARADYARILGTLYDLGYFSAIVNITLDGVEAAAVAPLDAPSEVRQVIVSVQPGPQFTFSRATIGPLAPGTRIPDDYAAGGTAGTGFIKTAARAGVEGWRLAGHAKADVGGQEIIADHDTNTVDSQVMLAPGPVVTFGPMRVTGLDRLTERRLRKIAGYPEGRRFDPEQIETVRKRLRRTGIFSAINLAEADDLNPDNSMDVNLTLVEQKPRRIGAGFEISNTDGAMVSAYWMHRNLLGGGERLRVEAKVSDIGSGTSGLDTEGKIRLERPATFHPDITAYVETSASRMREESYDSDTAALTFGANYIHSDRLTGNAAIQYRFQRVEDANGTTNFRVIALPLNVTWDRRDVPNDAKRGTWLSADVTPFLGFGETDSGAQLIGEGRAYTSFGREDRFTIAGRARLGTVVGSDIAATPRDYLFYSGGGGTVRGQPFRSLGVLVIEGPPPDNFPIETGGMSIVTASVEFRAQVRERIGAVAFVDAGRIWSDSAFGGDSGWHAGAGVGVRYATPIGPLRFDIAVPVGGNPDTGDGVQVYLGLGQSF